MQPLAIDLFCGLGGWSEGLLAEGWQVIGFDIERHEYGDEKYPAQLVLQDVLTIHGSQFKDAALIVASPPCQEYSYMAMPWSRAKAIRTEYLSGVRDRSKLTALFDACFRIQREACEAAGRHIPMVVENVRGACEWVGRSRWNYGSFHLWGDVPALMPMTKGVQKFNPDGTDHPTGSWFAVADSKNRGAREGGQKTPAGNCSETMWKDSPIARLAHATPAEMELHGFKVPGFRFDGSGKSFQTASVAAAENGAKGYVPEGTQALGKHGHPRILPQIVNKTGSGSKARKAASAKIAKIPLPLSRYIASVYKP